MRKKISQNTQVQNEKYKKKTEQISVMRNQYNKQVKYGRKKEKIERDESVALWVPGKWTMLATWTYWRGNEAQLALRSAGYWPCHCFGACFFPVWVTTPCLPGWIMLQRCMKTCIKYWEQSPWIRWRRMLCVQISSAPLVAYWHC